MSAGAWLQLAVFLALLLALAWPLARGIDAVMGGRFVLGRRLESPLFKLAGVLADEETGWLRYALGLLVFNGLGLLAVYALQRWQAVLPLNPQGMAAVPPDLAGGWQARVDRIIPARRAVTAAATGDQEIRHQHGSNKRGWARQRSDLIRHGMN